MVSRLVAVSLTLSVLLAAVNCSTLPRQDPPKQPNQLPAKFETSSNQFRGNWTVVKWDGTKLQIERAVEGKARNTTLTPSPAAWQAFWKEMDTIKVWKWEKEYIDKTLADGHSWSLNFEYSGRKIASGGSNRFPQQFNRYEKALKQLLTQEGD